MPQIRLECSPRVAEHLDSTGLFSALHDLMVSVAGATLEACKSRIILVNYVHVADGAVDRDLAVLEVGLLEGRTPETLTAVGTQSLKLLQDAVAEATHDLRVGCSVRIVEMPLATYFK